ncbi:MAG: hypothetical protein HZC40_04865 [Chloroflexi bacterium]|nr:hypothetical protein [Chloroflexota bacterium]
MSEPNANADPRVRIAFLLGWSVSELHGRLRKGVRPMPRQSARATESAPRLDVADGEIEKFTDAFVFTAQRVARFFHALEFETPAHALPLSQEIFALPENARAWLAGARKFYTPRELRDLLNAWTMHVWAQLDAASPASAQAFTAGMSLADTYWYLRLPARRPARAPSGESWQRLLSKFRLDVERTRLASLEKHLPAYVAPVIRNQLRAWSIGTDLVYRDGKLMRDPTTKNAATLTPEDETHLQNALEKQTSEWSNLLFEWRTATSYLRDADRRWIVIGRRVGLFGVLLITTFALALFAVWIAIFLSVSVLPGLFTFLNQKQPGLGDWLGIVNFLWTLLIAAPAPLILRAIFQATRTLQQWLDDQLMIYFINRRTAVTWNRYLKEQ